jgi:hypothetical protein
VRKDNLVFGIKRKARAEQQKRREMRETAVRDFEEAFSLFELSRATQLWVKSGEESRQASLRVAGSNVAGGGGGSWPAIYASRFADAKEAVENANGIYKDAVQSEEEAVKSISVALSTLQRLDATLFETMTARFEVAKAKNAWTKDEQVRMEARVIAVVKGSAREKARQQALLQRRKNEEREKNKPYIPYFPMTRWP